MDLRHKHRQSGLGRVTCTRLWRWKILLIPHLLFLHLLRVLVAVGEQCSRWRKIWVSIRVVDRVLLRPALLRNLGRKSLHRRVEVELVKDAIDDGPAYRLGPHCLLRRALSIDDVSQHLLVLMLAIAADS